MVPTNTESLALEEHTLRVASKAAARIVWMARQRVLQPAAPEQWRKVPTQS